MHVKRFGKTRKRIENDWFHEQIKANITEVKVTLQNARNQKNDRIRLYVNSNNLNVITTYHMNDDLQIHSHRSSLGRFI